MPRIKLPDGRVFEARESYGHTNSIKEIESVHCRTDNEIIEWINGVYKTDRWNQLSSKEKEYYLNPENHRIRYYKTYEYTPHVFRHFQGMMIEGYEPLDPQGIKNTHDKYWMRIVSDYVVLDD